MLLVAIPLLLTMAPAMAQTNMIYTGQTVDLSVQVIPGDTYTWELYSDVSAINFATDAGNCNSTDAVFAGGVNTGPAVHITCYSPGTYFYKVTAYHNGCSMNFKIGKIDVQLPPSSASLSLTQASICTGQSTSLVVSFTGTAPWSFTYRVHNPDGTASDSTLSHIASSPAVIPISPGKTGTYTFEVISVTDAVSTNTNISNTTILNVNARPGSSRIYQYDPISKKKK
jgi:plastocyanin